MIRKALVPTILTRTSWPILAAALVLGAFGRAAAQTDTPETPLMKQIDKIDLSITGVGEFNTTVKGPIQRSATDSGQTITQYGSNTFGAVVSLRYIAKPYVGLEANYGYARYTENYTTSPYQIQTRVNEYTLGYVVTPAHMIFGLQPYVSAGAGSIAFKPTPHGGEGAPEQARAVYYYNVGLQDEFYQGHFGLRAGFRQLFFLDPDFGQNYLTILKHTSTYEPQVGFYFRY